MLILCQEGTKLATRIHATRGKMRKSPRQARSRETVSAIVEAAARVLGRRGWAHLTTNEVADVAGVSIGSLYQYFPNKGALVEAVIRRHLDDLLDALRTVHGDDVAHLTIEARIERVVRAIIAAHTVDPELHRVLAEEVPRPVETAKSIDDGFHAEYQRLFAAIIGAGSPTTAAQQLMLDIISGAIEGAVHDAARHKRLSSSALVSELTCMVTAYLQARS
jgi:AcrR family transcriptional regulator